MPRKGKVERPSLVKRLALVNKRKLAQYCCVDYKTIRNVASEQFTPNPDTVACIEDGLKEYAKAIQSRN